VLFTVVKEKEKQKDDKNKKNPKTEKKDWTKTMETRRGLADLLPCHHIPFGFPELVLPNWK